MNSAQKGYSQNMTLIGVAGTLFPPIMEVDNGVRQKGTQSRTLLSASIGGRVSTCPKSKPVTFRCPSAPVLWAAQRELQRQNGRRGQLWDLFGTWFGQGVRQSRVSIGKHGRQDKGVLPEAVFFPPFFFSGRGALL